MHEKNIDEIIRLVLTRQASQEETEYLNTWLAQSPDNQQVFHHLQRVWQERAKEPQLQNAEQIRERIWQAGVEDSDTSFRSRYVHLIPYYLKVAAVLLLVLSLPLFVFIYQQGSQSEDISVRMIEKSNPVGQKLKLHLPDGSLVWLNADSKIRYAAHFSESTRTIELTGEAYFEVKRDVHKPFIVKSGPLSTTALGTSFNIAAYPEDSTIHVSLLSGKVKVQPNPEIKAGEATFLEKGYGIRFDKQRNQAQPYLFDEGKVVAWKQGILLFDGNSFEEVKQKLRRWYGVEITVTGTPPQDWKLTGRFKNEYLSTVLENIRFGRSFTYELTNDQLIFHFTKN